MLTVAKNHTKCDVNELRSSIMILCCSFSQDISEDGIFLNLPERIASSCASCPWLILPGISECDFFFREEKYYVNSPKKTCSITPEGVLIESDVNHLLPAKMLEVCFSGYLFPLNTVRRGSQVENL